MKRYEFNENRLGEVTIEESDNGGWIKYKDYVKMVMIVSHEPKDLLEDIEEGNEIIERKNKEIKELKNTIKKLLKGMWPELLEEVNEALIKEMARGK